MLSEVFEPFQKRTDEVRDRLVDGGIKQLSDEQLLRDYDLLHEIFSQLNEVCEAGTRTADSMIAVTKAVSDEIALRDSKHGTPPQQEGN